MDQKDYQKITKEILSVPGNARGDLLLNAIAYIKQQEGNLGFEKIKKELNNLGCLIDFENINRLDWYPKNINILIYFLCTEIFKWEKKDIFEMGRFAPKIALITRIIAKYLISAEKALQEASKNWKKYVDFGSAEISETNIKEKYAIIKIHNYKFHPVACWYLEGFFVGLLGLAVEGEKTIEETKCMHKNSPYHEFIIRW